MQPIGQAQLGEHQRGLAIFTVRSVLAEQHPVRGQIQKTIHAAPGKNGGWRHVMHDTSSLEYSLTATVCLEPKRVLQLRQIVSVEDFSVPACAAVFDAADSAVSRGKAFDANIAADGLRSVVDDPRHFLADCIDATPTLANAEEYARLLHRHAAEKRLRDGVLAALDEDNPAAAVAEVCKAHLLNSTGGRLKTISQALIETMSQLSARETQRINTGFPLLDSKLKGFEAGQLVIIGARPGVGKSAFLLDIAESAARAGNETLFVSLEMSAAELTERLLARRSAATMDQLIDRDVESNWDSIAAASTHLERLPLHFWDKPAATVSKIRGAAATIQNLRLIVIDYLGLMQADRRADSRNLELGQISRDLKNLASELQIPIVAAAQLNRGVSDTERPTLLSLRDSGELEQNGSKVLFLWRINEIGTVGVSVAKNRRGRQGVVQMHFDGEHQRFVELSEPYQEPEQKAERKPRGFL